MKKNFSSFSFSVSLTILVLPGSENTILLRKFFYWDISFYDSHLMGMPKSVISFEFP